LINIDNYFHQLAISTRKNLQEQGYQFVTSDFVFLEVADALTSPYTRQKTINFIRRFKNLPSLIVIPISDSLFQEGWIYSVTITLNLFLTLPTS
jgi:uncharacterized protein